MKTAILATVVMRGTRYSQRIKNLFGSSLIGYWPLNETSGAGTMDVTLQIWGYWI